MRTLLQRFICALAVSALAGTAAAQTTGTISGTITSSATGSPVADAAVQLFGPDGAVRASTNSGASGQFAFTAVTPATYYILVEAPGFARQLYSGIPCVAADCFSGFALAALGTPITVTAGATATANVALAPQGHISGTVRRAADSSVVTNALVRIYNSNTSLVGSVITLPDGTYSIGGLAAGSYYLRTDGNGTGGATDYLDELYGGVACPRVNYAFQCRIDQGTLVTVSAGATTANIDFSLDAGGRITGHVQAPPAVFGLPVVAYLDGVQVATGAVDGSGNYVIAPLPAGTYSVRTLAGSSSPIIDEWYDNVCAACSGSRPAGVTVAAGATASGIDFGLSTTPSTITGSLTLPALSFSGAVNLPSLLVYNSDGVVVKTIALGTSGSAFPAVAAGGTFTWTASGLPAGTYYVRTSSVAQSWPNNGHVGGSGGGFWVDELYSNTTCVAADCDPRSGTPVSVTAGATTAGVDFTLDIGAEISGDVPGGTFLGTTRLAIYDSRGVQLPGRVTTNAVTLDHTYFAPGLPAGTYYLKLLRDPSGAFPGALYKDIPCESCPVTSGTPVTVALGETKTDIDFTALASRSIRGTVRTDASAPLSTITVEVYALDGTRVRATSTSADGRYAVSGLVPGTYYARTVNARGYADEVYNNQACAGCDATGGSPVTVTADADTTGIDFSLAQGTSVSGSVTSDTGVPIGTAASVSIFTSAGTLAARAFANVFGRYSVALGPGTYRARTDAIAGYAQQLYRDLPCAGGACDVTAGTAIAVAGSPVESVDFALDVCSAPVISPRALAFGAVGVAYRQTFTVSGGTAPRRFSVVAGALPSGLALDGTTGVLSGTPTAAGHYTFTAAVSDAAGCAGRREYTLDIPACPFTLSSDSASLRASGEPWMITVTNACGSWTATSNASWIRIDAVSTSSVVIVADRNTDSGPRTGTVTIGPRVFTVHQSGVAATPAFGVVDVPLDGAVVTGSVAFGGWALDDIAVNRVLLYRDPAAGEAGDSIYLGDATFIEGARPDVEAAYPDAPFNRRAGWGFMILTNMLPGQGNGTFRIRVYAEDADLNRSLLGSRTINAVNATATDPFGAIDTPAQGGTVSGPAYVNFGWALTPLPKTIPSDGSTIQVIVDGAPLGNVTYGFYRSDVSGAFPGLNNSSGPVGYRLLDTTAMSDGLHTISWNVADDAGKATGIGSRYFKVNNSAWTASSFASGSSPEAVMTQEMALLIDRQPAAAPPPAVPGPDLGRRAASLKELPLVEGARAITIQPVERLELSLATDTVDGRGCEPTYDGYLVARGEMRELPVGATLDRRGTFYWQPGPGFIGRYQLVFVRTDCDGSRARSPVTVTIAPR